MAFARDTLTTFGTSLLKAGLTFVGLALIARAVGPGGKGVYELLILVPMLLVNLGHLGIGTSNTFYGGRRLFPLETITGNSIICGLLLGSVMAVGLAVFLSFTSPSFLAEVPEHLLFLALTTVPIGLVTLYLLHVLLAETRIGAHNSVQALQAVIGVALVLVLVSIKRWGLPGAIAAYVVAQFSALVAVAFLVRRHGTLAPKLDSTYLRESVRFGVKGYAGNVISFVNYRLDMLLVAVFLDTSQVGQYSVAVNITEALWLLPAAAGLVLFSHTPRNSVLHSNATTPIVCRTVLFITLLAAAGLGVAAPVAVPVLFGQPFAAALQPLYILLPGVSALAINKVLCNELIGRGKPLVGTWAAIVSLVLNVPLNLLLIPRIGIAGAALASTISYAVCTIVPLVAFKRVSGVHYRELVLVNGKDLKRLSAGISTVIGQALRRGA